MRNSEKKLRIMFNAGLKCGKLHPDDNSYDKIHFECAIKKCSKLQDDLLQDKELWEAWKSNIAMAYKDNYNWHMKKKKNPSFNDRHIIANKAAEYFLSLLTDPF